MRLVRLVAGAALGTLLASAGCSQAGPVPDEGATATIDQAVQAGATDTTNKHSFAVGVCLGNPSANGPGPSRFCQGVCTGTLVLPNMVITARHCISETAEPVKPNDRFGPPMGGLDNFFVTTNYRMRAGDPGWHNVKEILIPQEDRVIGNDIAIIILEDLIPSTEAKLAIPGVQYPMGDGRYSVSYTAIGYGKTSPGAEDSGTRRFKENQSVLCVPGDEHLGCPGEEELDPKEFFGDDGTCKGDSGSGAFEKRSYDQGKPVSWGVLSRGGEDANNCRGSAYTRLDAWRDFVVEGARQASNDWKLYPKPNPDWTVYVPPAEKDAGADAKPKPTKPTGAPLGDACEADADCESKICVDAPDGSRVCSADCDEAAELFCADGFVCQDGLCFVEGLSAPAPAVDAPKKKDTGCSSSPAGPSSGLPFLFAGIGLAAASARRRRRA